jgi:putative cell wall-binding protein
MKIYHIVRLLIVLILFFAFLPYSHVKAASNSVVPIDWGSFQNGNPRDEDANRIKDILLNTNKYGLTTWWNTEKNFDSQSGTYLDFGGRSEHEIRHPAAMSLGLATSLAFNVYNPSITGISEAEALQKTRKLIRSLGYRHKANMKGGWGDHWQSAHWAYFTGFAGWLIWDELSSIEREYVRKMVEYEANRFNSYDVPYWKSETGKTIYDGDTKAEENAWNAQLLQLATVMMPNHQNWQFWMNKNIELMVSSAAVPSDINNEEIINGKSIKDWIRGININEDGTVINHGFVHPDYMEFIAFNNTSGLHYTLAGMSTPEAAFHHSDLVYSVFSEMKFKNPPYDEPGGTIYQEGSSDIYYPQGNDWGTDRRMQFATLDIFADVFQFDQLASKGGEYWEPLHAQKVLDMQRRHEDGHTYDEHKEDKYRGREEWVAHHAAWAWIAKWVEHSGEYRVTDQSYGPTVERLSGSGRYSTAVSISERGWEDSNIVILASGSNFPDALAGAPLAKQYNAPILLTEKDELPEITKKEIVRLGAEKVIILGGTSAVKEIVEKELKVVVNDIERLGGVGRFETAGIIAEKLNSTDTAFIVNGYNFPDALSVAAVAAKSGNPILLTDPQKLPFHTSKALKNVKNKYIVGGSEAVTDHVAKELGEPKRIDGNNRYETAANIIRDLNLSPKQIMVANGESFSDALAGSVLAASQQANLLLVEPKLLPYSTRKIINGLDIQHYTILGGNKVVSEDLSRVLMKE